MQERGGARVGKGKKGGKRREGARGRKEKREGGEGKRKGKKGRGRGYSPYHCFRRRCLHCSTGCR